jgi:hypothetical protein
MQTHPELEDLVAYAEQAPGFARLAAIEAHLRTCRQCVLEIAELRNLRDLELEGRLIASGERAAAARPGPKLRDYLKQAPGSRPVSNTILGIVGGVIASGIAALSPPPGAEPAFAAHGDEDQQNPTNIDPGHVRTDDGSASLSLERSQMPRHDITKADPIIGTPGADSRVFPGQQGYPDTCAIRCQEFIIRQYTGLNLPEKYYVDEAKAHGWYHSGEGTRASDVGKLLEAHEIPVHRYTEANVYNLTAELARGHKVIIGVDSEDLWSTSNPFLNGLRHALGLAEADHAVVVSGIDTSDPEHVRVIVSDPGTGEVAARYPIEKFVMAWKDSHFFMVATQEPTPPHLHLPEMANFDYHAGHIQHIGALSYDEFQHLASQHDAHAHDATWLAHHNPTEHLIGPMGHGEHAADSGPVHHDPSSAADPHDSQSEHPLPSLHSDPHGHLDDTGHGAHHGHEDAHHDLGTHDSHHDDASHDSHHDSIDPGHDIGGHHEG